MDHIAVAGETLQQAEALVEAALGCAAGHGAHPHFGTHNALWGLGAEFYMEAIAIDPKAPKPDWPRWFGLDQFTGAARAATWILKTDDMRGTLAQLGPDFGTPVSLKRGPYAWQISVPGGGANGFDGLAPAIIQWDGGRHPAPDLADCGTRLKTMTVQHPKAALLADQLCPMLDDDRVQFVDGPVALRAQFDGPAGLVTLK